MTLTEASFQHCLWPIVIKGLSFLSRSTTTPLPACDTPSSNPAGPACHSWILNHFCKLPSMMLSNLKLASSTMVGSEGHISLVAVPHSTVWNIWKLHSRETAPCVCETGCLWTTHSERKPTRKSATDITQPHTFEGKTLKSIKQTTMSPFFLSAAKTQMLLYYWCSSTHSVIATPSQGYFPRWLHCIPMGRNYHFQLLLPHVCGSTRRQRICSAPIFGRKNILVSLS